MDNQLMSELEAIGGEIRTAGLKGGDQITISQPSFTARIALWGGHLASFQPSGEPDLLFQSANLGGDTRFSRRHFGVPVCWPWFGAHPSDKDFPSHGLARYFRWQLAEVGHFKNGDIKVVLKLASDEHPLIEDMCPQTFELRQIFRFGSGFQVNFSAANLSDKPLLVSEALHTYFHVGDNELTQVKGLDGVLYEDKFTGQGRQRQEGDIQPCQELDRVYLDAPAVTLLEDQQFNRRLIISTEGSASTVLWNPGQAIAASRSDMENDDYRHFVCVESANALDNSYVIEAGGMHHLKLEVKFESLSY